MRLLLEFQAQNNFVYLTNYHHKLQGFIYSLLRETSFHHLHDSDGYKFIAFSNIFPPFNAKEGDTRKLIISSPDEELIQVLQAKLASLEDSTIRIGHMLFRLVCIKPVRPTLRSNVRLITATPIVIRVPREKFIEYNPSWDRKYDYVYWRSHHSFKLFIEQLVQNLTKKYQEFYSRDIKISNFFDRFNFKKQVCNHVVINGKEVKVIGTLWEFFFRNPTRRERKFLSFALACGLGELNSLGFGFVNNVGN
ncbi:MAG: CRISPR-associated endoribonuclease Cas6 [Candidatus Heimdallarchaeota archaeon]|nr:CRISPR-associated endoribonuclease Cas6 [Candidatus Heimdallarchaeota archaeon]